MPTSRPDWLAAFYFFSICGLAVPAFLSEVLWVVYSSGGHTMIAPGTSALIALAVMCFGLYLSCTQIGRLIRVFHPEYHPQKVARTATLLFILIGFPYFLWSIELFMQGMDFSTKLTAMTPVGVVARALGLAIMTVVFYSGIALSTSPKSH